MKEKYTILIVDDEESILNSLKRLFRNLAGYEVLTTTSAIEALAIVNDKNIDMVISDQRMPEMQGVELLKMVKEKDQSIIRILLSGYSDIDSLVGAINEGEVYKFIAKPWKSEELINIIGNALRHQDVVRVVSGIVNKIKSAAKNNAAVKVDTEHNEHSIKVKVETGAKIISNNDLREILGILMAYTLENNPNEDMNTGLNCASGMIEKHKGKIIFTLNVEAGMTLIFELPLEQAKDS